ncbi:MAG TPA: Ig-like domain-containing protein [Gemmatimonadales bacterium]|nr:Ig-like domain-containing protein [Gemmatimonadales bacterium]
MKADLNRLARAGVALAAVTVVAWFVGCSDNPGGPCSACPPPSLGLNVSNPIPGTGLAVGAAPVHASGALANGADVVYVSLAPGTVPTGSRAIVRRLGDSNSLTTAVTDGGFDPVPVDAQVRDSIEVLVTDGVGGTVLQLRAAVAAARPPVVVRTDPPPKKRDVPLNAAIVIVFSEPIAPASLTPSSVQVLRGSTPVTGTVGLLGGTTAAVVFTPAAPLEPNTDYRLVVTRAVRDLENEPLSADTSVPFRTGTAVVGPTSLVRVYPDTATLRATAQLQLYVVSLDSMALPVTGRPVTWSSDNPTVASVSVAGLVTGLAAGQAHIRAEVDGQAGVAAVRVGELGSVQVAPDSALVLTGLTTTLTAVLRDGAGGLLPLGTVSWSSSDAGVATVTGRPDGTAIVTAIAAGIATITATAEDKSGTAAVKVVTSLPGTSSGLIAFEAIEKIWIMNADGSFPTVLADNVVWRSGVSRAITWSPDGRTIAFAGAGTDTTTKTEIYGMKVDGSGLTRLTFGTASAWDPDWSPDGSRIAFVSDRSGTSEIHVMNADGSGVKQLTNIQGALAPAWSPDGRRIAFTLAGNIIYVMNADGSGLSRLSDPNASDHDPAWSPDGAKIVFGTYREGNYSVIYSMNADGSGATRLTEGSQPTWSPNQRIAFVQGAGTSSAQLWAINDDGSSLTRLGGSPEGLFGVARPAWSPVTAQLPAPVTIQKAPTNSGDGQTDTVFATLRIPLRVLVQRYGAPAPGVAISWAVLETAGGTLSATTTITDATGIASVSETLGSIITYSGASPLVEATVPGAAGSPVRFKATVNPGNPTTLVPLWGNSSVGLVSMPTSYGVRATDAYGNTALTTRTRIDWAVTTGGGSITPAEDTTLAGDASATHTLGPDEGTQTATATASELLGSPQMTFTTRAVTAIVWVSNVGDEATGTCLNVFDAANVTVSAGRTVAWLFGECASARAHNVTFEDDPDPPTSSPTQYPIRHFRTFATPGVYRYRCTLHSTDFTHGEVGTVVVQ